MLLRQYNYYIMSKDALNNYIETIKEINDYSSLIEWFNSLSKGLAVNHSIRTPENFVYGCQISTWFTCANIDGELKFSFDSDSNIVNGIVKILLDTLTGLTREEITQVQFYDFREISARLPIERQRTLQFILNKAHKLANITGDTH